MPAAAFALAEDEYLVAKENILAAISSDPTGYRRHVSKFEEVTVRLVNASFEFARKELTEAKQNAFEAGATQFKISSTLSNLPLLHSVSHLLESEVKLGLVPSESSDVLVESLTALNQQLATNASKLVVLDAERLTLRSRIQQLRADQSALATKASKTSELEHVVHDGENRLHKLLGDLDVLRHSLEQSGSLHAKLKIELDQLAHDTMVHDQRVSALNDEIFLLETERNKSSDTMLQLQELIADCVRQGEEMRDYEIDDVSDFIIGKDFEDAVPEEFELEDLERQVKLLRLQRFNSFGI